MPANLNTLTRIRIIDQCLKNRSVIWNWENLALECEKELGKIPSRETIMKDIKIMRSGQLGFNAPITWNKKEKSYEYSNPKFSISNMVLKESELQELRNALNILNQFKGFKQFENIGEIILKLEQSVNAPTKNGKAVVHFDTNPNARGLNWLDLLYHKIISAKTAGIRYQPFNFDHPYWVTVSPYLLKEYNNRWFLFAYEHKDKRVLNFALDRIEAIQDSIQAFHFIENFNPDHFFRNIIGVTIPEGEQIQQVLIEANREQAKYIDTKPLHHSQYKMEEKANSTIFSFHLIPNYELESMILSFGEKVKVLTPDFLKERIRDRISNSHQNYSKN